MARDYDPDHPLEPTSPSLINRVRCLVYGHLDYVDLYDQFSGSLHLICIRCSGTKTITYPKANVVGEDTAGQE